jgi:hypothetical protein
MLETKRKRTPLSTILAFEIRLTCGRGGHVDWPNGPPEPRRARTVYLVLRIYFETRRVARAVARAVAVLE